jgi:hypothetical protein
MIIKIRGLKDPLRCDTFSGKVVIGIARRGCLVEVKGSRQLFCRMQTSSKGAGTKMQASVSARNPKVARTLGA